MLTYSLEPWALAYQEAKKYLERHASEVGLTRLYGVPLKMDEGRFGQLEREGKLQVVVARLDGEMVGYHVSIVDTLLHYKPVLAAMSDAYWIRPDCRNGILGVKLFRAVEEFAKLRGVQFLFDSTKICLDNSRMFEWLGYNELERRYAKRLEG